jgi:transposase, IS30 family
MAKHLTVEQRKMARRFKAAGFTLRETAAQLGCAFSTAREVWYFESKIALKSDEWTPGPGRLKLGDREEISLGLHGGETLAAIAHRLGRSTSTISREVAANGGRANYRAWRAHKRASTAAKRPKVPKLTANKELLTQVAEWLEMWWSPEQIARRLRIEFPDDPMMRVSHETIYQSLFVQGRGELRRELARCLRSGRVKRQPKHRTKRKALKDMVMISARPAAVEDRAVPGHWEGDLIIGKEGASAVGTLVERTTRFVLLLHLPDDHGAAAVDQAMRRAISTLPGELFRTITWDQGRELALHASFTVATGIQVYFCDPHSPWQRGSNENTNGLLRQYMPKSTDLSVHSPDDLAAIARSLNNRPRETLGYMKPSEKLAELFAHTA